MAPARRGRGKLRGPGGVLTDGHGRQTQRAAQRDALKHPPHPMVRPRDPLWGGTLARLGCTVFARGAYKAIECDGVLCDSGI